MKLLALLTLLLLSLPAYAQQETLFSNVNVGFGGAGGPAVGISTIDGDPAVFTGGFGGLIINMDNQNSLTLGGGGYGLSNNIRVDRPGIDETEYLVYGYGGFYLEYTHRTYKLVHLTARSIIGAGHVGYRPRNHYSSYSSGSEFFVAEPAISAEINVTNFFRFGAGVAYRFVAGSNSSVYSDADLSGVMGVATFKFGKF